MKAGDIFRASEMSALAGAGAGGGEITVGGSGFVSNVHGKEVKKRKKFSKGKALSLGATGCIAGMALLAAFAVGGGNLMPVGILERLVESTDTQSANLTQDKFTIFGDTMETCTVASDSAAVLKNQGYLVGHMEGDNFVEGGKDCDEAVLMEVEGTEPVAQILEQVGYLTMGELVKYGYVFGDENGNAQLADNTDTPEDNDTTKDVKYTGKIITADNFRQKANSDVKLYNAMNLATFDRSGAYYDEEATAIFKSLGTSRHNFPEGSDFDEVMNKINKSGSSVSINSEGKKLQPRENDEGIIEMILDWFTGGGSSSSSSAEEFIEQTRNDIWAEDSNTAAKDVGNAITKADQITQEQHGALLAATYMEPIDMIRADDGSEVSHDVMNRLLNQCKSTYLNEETGTMEETNGAIVESPTMYALLTDQPLAETEGFRNREVLQNTIQNKVGKGDNKSKSTVVSSDDDRKGSIGRYVELGQEEADENVVKTEDMIKAVDASMMTNSYEDIKCEAEGEVVGSGMQSLQTRFSRATGGTLADGEAMMAYARLNEQMLAMEAKADRLNRSPFDITSKNTFLGSIVYSFAMASIKNAGLRNFAMGLGTVASAVGDAISGLLPQSSAEDTLNFMTEEGDCEAINGIGAMAPKNCTEIMAFDTSTFDMLDDPSAQQFLDTYTTYDENTHQRTIREDVEDNPFVKFIDYNVLRETPSGSPDGAILEDLSKERLGILADIPIISDILSMIDSFRDAEQWELDIANGQEFVNSSSNSAKWAGTGDAKWAGAEDSTMASTQVAVVNVDGGGNVDDNSNDDGGDSSTSDNGGTDEDDTEEEESASRPQLTAGGYKWVQRYVSMSRARKILMQNSSDPTAYRDMKYFEGEENAIVAYIKKHHPDAVLAMVGE